MPNAAKLVAAIGMAIVAFIVSQLVKELFEEETNFGWFTYVNVALGCVVGWSVMGSRAGRGGVSAVNVGLTTSVVLVFWALFAQSCNEMVRLAMRNRFDGAFEALVAIFELGVEYLMFMSTGLIWVVLLGGGVVVGLITEQAWRRWP